MRCANLATELADTMAYDQCHYLVSSIIGRLPLKDRPLALAAFMRWGEFNYAYEHPAALRALAAQHWTVSGAESMVLTACADWIDNVYFAEMTDEERERGALDFAFSR